MVQARLRTTDVKSTWKKRGDSKAAEPYVNGAPPALQLFLAVQMNTQGPC